MNFHVANKTHLSFQVDNAHVRTKQEIKSEIHFVRQNIMWYYCAEWSFKRCNIHKK